MTLRSDPTAPVTVLIADDEELTRTGLRTLLAAHTDLAVVGEASDGAEAVALAAGLRPEVVLMDVRMPDMDGIEATRRLRAASREPPKVIAITTFESDDYVYDALSAGAQGFVLKRAPVATIAQAVRLVAHSDCLLFPDSVRELVTGRGRGRNRLERGGTRLTEREAEVLRLMANGLSNQEIATALYVSLETVKTHVGNVLMKVGAGNRTQAVIAAYESGFVTAGRGVANGSM